MFCDVSILDQQQKQSIPFSGGTLLGEYDGKIFVARDRDLFALVPIPVETQVRTLYFYNFSPHCMCGRSYWAFVVESDSNNS